MQTQLKPGPGSNPLLRLIEGGAVARKEGESETPPQEESTATKLSPPVEPRPETTGEMKTQSPVERRRRRERVNRNAKTSKGTYYIEQLHDEILEEIRLKLRKRGDRAVDKSRLVREAIEDLAKKYERLSHLNGVGE